MKLMRTKQTILLTEWQAEDRALRSSRARPAVCSDCGARELVEECRALSDSRLVTPYDLYEERIEDCAGNPPGADWDGVYMATRK